MSKEIELDNLQVSVEGDRLSFFIYGEDGSAIQLISPGEARKLYEFIGEYLLE